jgi:hypothetical protein
MAELAGLTRKQVSRCAVSEAADVLVELDIFAWMGEGDLCRVWVMG